jgi:type IV pilus assembly protein PilM
LANAGVDQTVALVDVGASIMTVNVLRNRQSLYMREQPFGGDQLTQEIQRSFSLSEDEAEAAKKNGGLPQNYEHDVLNPFMETLALEVTRALQFFFTSTQFNEVNYIVLAGGCSTLPGLEGVVAKRAQVQTRIANPFESIEKSDRVKGQQLSLDAPALMVACGLAMRRLET